MKTRIRRIRLRIRYKRRSDLVILAALALVLVTAACLGTLAWGQKEASADVQAAPAAFAPMRKYYVTQSEVTGSGALTACASGYHMASLWEILDPSRLEYTDLGYTRADSGAGPPTGIPGWVRTGADSWSTAGIGYDNCAVWDSDSGYGTGAYLPGDWTGGLEDVHIWNVWRYQCGVPAHVWCVEDYPSFTYLPLVLRNH